RPARSSATKWNRFSCRSVPEARPVRDFDSPLGAAILRDQPAALFFCLLFSPPVRRVEFQPRADGDDARRVDHAVAEIVVLLDMPEINRGLDARYLVELARVA